MPGTDTPVRQLRPYQRDAVASVHQAWADGHHAPAVVMATGLGKSTVAAQLVVDHATSDHPRPRVLVLAHRQELLDQLQAAISAVTPAASPAGRTLSTGQVVAARDEVDADIVIASVATVHRRRRYARIATHGPIGLVVIDECHHAAADTYLAILDHVGVRRDTSTSGDTVPDRDTSTSGDIAPDPHRPRAVGLTATLARTDDRALAEVFTCVSYSMGILAGIEGGYLVRPVGVVAVVPGLDLDGVTVRAGDYADGQLGGAVEAAKVDVVDAIVRHTAARRTRVVFVPTVAAAVTVAAELGDHMPTAVVVGETPHDVRAATYAGLASGELAAVVTVGVLTEGFDLPAIDCVVMARPTQSRGLYQQCVGRGLRPSPGKVDCLVLDLCPANRSHTLVTLDELITPDPDDAADTDDDDDTPTADDGLESGLVDAGEPDPVEVIAERVAPRDLFGDVLGPASRRVVWLTTPAGHRFCPGRDRWISFVWPVRPGVYWVGMCSLKGLTAGGWLATDGHMYRSDDRRWQGQVTRAELGDGPQLRERAEQVLSLCDTPIRASASWRSPSTGVTEAQVRMARSLGLDTSPSSSVPTSRAACSDAISAALAARILDRAAR